MERIHSRMSYILIIVILVFLILSFFNVNGIRNDVRDFSLDKQTFQARGIENDVERWVSENLNILYLKKDMISTLTYDELTYSLYLNKFMQVDYNYYRIDALYVGLETGEFITGREWIPDADYDPRVRPWYVGAEESNGPFVGDTYLDADTKKIICTFSLPIRTKDGVVGVIAIDLYMDTVTTLMDDLVKGTEFGVVLIDGSGVIIHYTGDNYLAGRPVIDYPNSKVSILYDHFKESMDKGILSQVRIDEDELVLFDKVSNSTWSIGVFTENGSVLSGAEKAIQRSYIIISSMILLIFALGYSIFKMDRQLIGDRQQVHDQTSTGAEREEQENQEKVAAAIGSVMDPLTSIFNRKYFDEQLEKYWNMARYEEVVIGLMVMDPDFFKKYNETYGYQAGDQVLVRLVKEFNRHLDPRFILSRFSGASFAILCFNADASEMLQIGEELRKSVEQLRIPHDGAKSASLSISIGLVEIQPGTDDSIGAFLHEAHSALYKAKSEGGNRIVVKSTI